MAEKEPEFPKTTSVGEKLTEVESNPGMSCKNAESSSGSGDILGFETGENNLADATPVPCTSMNQPKTEEQHSLEAFYIDSAGALAGPSHNVVAENDSDGSTYDATYTKRCKQIAVIKTKLAQDLERVTLAFDEKLDKDWIVRRQKLDFLFNESYVIERDIEYRPDPEIVLTQHDKLIDYFKHRQLLQDSTQLVEEIARLPNQHWIVQLPDPTCQALGPVTSQRMYGAETNEEPGIEPDDAEEDENGEGVNESNVRKLSRGFETCYAPPFRARRTPDEDDDSLPGGESMKKIIRDLREESASWREEYRGGLLDNFIVKPLVCLRKRISNSYNRIRQDKEGLVYRTFHRIRKIWCPKPKKPEPTGDFEPTFRGLSYYQSGYKYSGFRRPLMCPIEDSSFMMEE